MKVYGRDFGACATAAWFHGAADVAAPGPGSAGCPAGTRVAVPGLPACFCAFSSAPPYKNK